MQIGVLGTGSVGQAIATKLVAIGHAVTMGSRTAANERAIAWAKRLGSAAAHGTFAEAAATPRVRAFVDFMVETLASRA